MKHLGDITKISGYDVPMADCVIGGSPCQDLSIAGKRAGLAGERSGLFMEQIRIVKEMRERGRTVNDVRPRYMVWENVPGAFSSNKGRAFGAVLEEIVRIAEPESPDVPVPEKGWPTAGVVMGDGWSVAWRVLDAQFWGVPQRRRRIALVADFGGQTAPEILFVRKSLCGATEKSGAEGKKTTASVAASTTETSDSRGKIVAVAILDIAHANDVIRDCGETVHTLQGRMGTGGNQVPLIYDESENPAIRRLTPLECERLQGYPDYWTDIGTWYDSKGKEHETSDTARYKALGNSIALPPWKWVLKRICAQYERDATMASLFDGIGGFPLIWEQLNGKGSCLWASEIEEFPMAVTKRRFGE